MRSAVPPRLKRADDAAREEGADDDGTDGHDAQEEGAGQADAVDDLGQVVARGRTGSDARDEAAVLAQLVGRLVGLEGEGRVEVREADRRAGSKTMA